MARFTKRETLRARALIRTNPGKLADWLLSLVQSHEMREAKKRVPPPRNPVWKDDLTMSEVCELIEVACPAFTPPTNPWRHVRKFCTETHRCGIEDRNTLIYFCRWLGEWKQKPFDINTLCYFMGDWWAVYQRHLKEQGAPVTVGNYGGKVIK